jgi:hypothetical protein
VLVIDDSGDRKDGTATAHVGRQWVGRLGKTDNVVVTVTTRWADERVYFPLLADPGNPAHALVAAWSPTPPPAELQALIDAVGAGHGLHLYLPP